MWLELATSLRDPYFVYFNGFKLSLYLYIIGDIKRDLYVYISNISDDFKFNVLLVAWCFIQTSNIALEWICYILPPDCTRSYLIRP